MQIVPGTIFSAFVGPDESSNGGAVESYLGLSSLKGTSELTDTALLGAVQNTPNSIAIIDLPWNINQGNEILAQAQIDTVSPLTSPTLNLDPGQSEANFNNYILQALKSTSNPRWPDNQAFTAGTLLTNHFFAVTKGTPSALAQKFIQFMQNPNAQSAFDSQGLLAIYEYTLAQNGAPLILFFRGFLHIRVGSARK
jgi:ABC-type phosphate transport system substrate-binding protein